MNPLQALGNAIGAVLSYLNQRRTEGRLDSLQAEVDALNDAWAKSTDAMQFVFDQVHGATIGVFSLAQGIGGTIRTIGYNQQILWHKLRWELMPNTIQYIWDFVYWAWIGPLRRHIHIFAWNQAAWNNWSVYNISTLAAWGHWLEAIGRNHRARWVYPQIANLLYPPRVAYWYCRDILTEITLFLSYEGHHETRDAVTRVVWSNGPRLWRYMEDAFLRFLETEIDGTGFGSQLPQRGAGATFPMPEAPPQWEPWLPEFDTTDPPNVVPNIPELNWSYDQ